MRSTFTIVGILLVFGLGFFVAWQLAAPSADRVRETSAEVMLERVETVAKMVTVEGYFAEIYAHQEFRRFFNAVYWDRLFMEVPAFRKKALIRVRGKVSVGYDLEQMRIDLDAETRTIRISNLPEPSIISTEHDLEYYDIYEGTFNNFTEEDFNRINAEAKQVIIEQAEASDLFARAEAQGNELLDLIGYIAAEGGWTVERAGRPALAD